MTNLRLNDFVPVHASFQFVGNEEVTRAWVDLRPENAPGDRNILRTMDIGGAWRTLFYFPENTVVVVKEEPC